MFGMFDAIYAYLNRMVGNRTDAANANGSLHAKTTDIKNSLGSINDAANPSGSVHAKLSSLVAQSNIKSVQRGLTLCAGGGAGYTTNITISSVNTSKSFVSITARLKDISVYSANFTARLTSGTNIEVQNYTHDGSNPRDIYVSWEVIEYY